MAKWHKEVEHILIRIKRKERNSRELLYKKAYGLMISIARFYLNNKKEAEDVASEALLRVFKYIENYDTKQSGYGWLCRMVQNVALDYNEKAKRYFYCDSLDNRKNNAVEWEEEIMQKDMITRWLSILTEIDRKIMTLYFYEGLTCVEIGKRMGMKKSNVSKRICLAKEEIIKNFSKKEKNF